MIHGVMTHTIYPHPAPCVATNSLEILITVEQKLITS